MSRTHPTRVPLGFLAMLLIVGGIEARAGRLIVRSIRFEAHWVWARAAIEASRGNEILCLGDSQVKNSVYPAVIEAETGRKVYNLAQNGSQVPASYFLLRRALDHGARPKALVVGFNPALLSRGCDRRSALWLGLAGPRDWLSLADWLGKPGGALEATLRIVSPSIRERAEIRLGLLGSLRGEDRAAGSAFDRSFQNDYQDRNWTINRGAQVLPDYHVPRDPPLWYQVDYPAPWSIDPMIAGYLDRLLKLADARKIRVYWLLHPVDPEGQELLDRSGQEERFGRFLVALKARHKNLILVDGHHSFYDRSAFTDMVHLHDRGATALSFDLGAILDQPIPESRQFRLPPYRTRPVSPRLEDLSRSIVAVRDRPKAAGDGVRMR